MIWWILGILALLIVLLCLLRVGVRISMAAGALTVRVRVGPFGFRVYPGKEKPEKEESPPEEKPKKEKPQKPEKKRPKPTLTDIRSAAQTLWPPLKRALGRFGRGIRIHPLQVSITFGGSQDAAGAAELYGYAHAAVWTVMPVLEQLVDIPAPGIHIGLDFDSPATVVEGEAGITIRVGTLLAMGFGVGIPALRWFLAWNKEQKQRQPETAPAGQTAA